MINLDRIAIKHNCDKSSIHHDYCKIYDKYLKDLRNKPISFLELGYGGYEDPNAGGESAMMWREYFTKATITVVDIHEKTNVPDGVTFVKTSQDNYYQDSAYVIVDDASHVNLLTIQSFKNCFKFLKSGGLYFIEDLHSSYDPYYSDANPNPQQGDTTMNFLKSITDSVNNDFLNEYYKLSYDIEFIHFYKELAVIKKK